ncbi:hypothetical protein [Photobacterium kishitanii]|uniref:Uncharacterized protein n=1 Tax=Photobacterium kishitanii TaxID=318456 RepID=A0A2T3KLU1_9GAMM|nr:hypothetical protein [Photobacterium kishitanii]PSV00636.1 hypothetical protein C9J27_05725 [Photobacterium kishitanii]
MPVIKPTKISFKPGYRDSFSIEFQTNMVSHDSYFLISKDNANFLFRVEDVVISTPYEFTIFATGCSKSCRKISMSEASELISYPITEVSTAAANEILKKERQREKKTPHFEGINLIRR